MSGPAYYMRTMDLVLVTGGSQVFMIGREDVVLSHPTTTPAAWSQLFQALATPLAEADFWHLAATLSDVDNGFWDHLIHNGLLLRLRDADELLAIRNRLFHDNRAFNFVPHATVCRHLIFACTGSITSGLVAPTILSLNYSRFAREMDVVLTEAACRFVTPYFFESYGIRTWADAFVGRDDIYVPHVQLARSADCVVVMPASASSLNRIANSTCTDLLSMLTTATTAPVIVAPVMNEVMWNNRGVQRNVQSLRDNGAYVIEPTIIVGAADLTGQGRTMYGGPGTFWLGPLALMDTLATILRHHAGDTGGSLAEALPCPPCGP